MYPFSVVFPHTVALSVVWDQKEQEKANSRGLFMQEYSSEKKTTQIGLLYKMAWK